MASFFSPYSHEFVRLGACVPHVAVADPRQNADNVLDLLALGDKARIALMVFPELGISAYAIDDLLLQDALLDEVKRQLDRLISASRDLFPVFVVGAPLRHRGHLYDCSVVVHRGMLLGVVPKVYLPNYREFYERRQLTSGEDIIGQSIEIVGHEAPFGRDLLFAAQGNSAFTFHVEICEDLWVPHPPSTDAALAGAEILLNLSASNITIGKSDMRRLLCASQASRCIAAYAYSAAGVGESTTDLAWDGQAGIFELSDLLAETERFSPDPEMAVADVDLGRIRQERMRTNTFGDNGRALTGKHPEFRTVAFAFAGRSSASPMYRRSRRCCGRTATRPTTSRSRDSRSA
jgi:NAD+ synthase (glutamine-hydrolysing)